MGAVKSVVPNMAGKERIYTVLILSLQTNEPFRVTVQMSLSNGGQQGIYGAGIRCLDISGWNAEARGKWHSVGDAFLCLATQPFGPLST